MIINSSKTLRKNVVRLIIILQYLSINILFAQTPVASFISDVQTGCAPLSVNFTNGSTGATAYSWNFGNTNTSTLYNPSTVFLVPDTYTVVLIATNTANGQQSTTSATIIVVPDPIANFTAAVLSGCAGSNSICFNNTSQYASSYIWDFGDGNSSNAISPCHTYNSPGTYTVKLIVANPYGCQGIKIRNSYVTIYPKPSASFTSNITSTCNVSDVFNFTTGSNAGTSWQWNFGDNSTSALQNPSHTYSVSGTYTVSLIVINASGCSDTLVKPNYINIGASLVPSFTMSDTAGCIPLSINFNCTVANATSWNWTFGDGNVSAQQNPVNNYTGSGSYTITLSVTTQSGCNGSITLTNFVVVDPAPVASFTVVQDTGCAPYVAQFNNSSTGASTYLWDFGDGTTDVSANPSHNFTTGGNYSITLHAYSPNGCETILTKTNLVRVLEPKANFTGTPLIGCPGITTAFATSQSQVGTISWQWTFGDGATSSLQNPSHTYAVLGNYNVFLIVTNSFGCKDTAYRPNYVQVVPGTVPYTLPDTIKACQNTPVNFTDPTIGSNTWLWNFGDGGTSTVKNPSHVYVTPGFYTVTLNTSMPGGCSQTFNPFAIVEVIAYDPKPLVATILSSCKPYLVSFSTTTANIVSYQWNFGDGTTSSLAAPTHTYYLAGTYNVTLNITVGNGCQSTLSTTVILGHTNPMQVNSNNVCLPASSLFSLTTPAAFTIVKWNFGDATTSTQLNPSHTYAAIGNYTPSLITTDIAGCIDTFTLAPIVVNNPIAAFNVVGNTTVCQSEVIQFNNTSTNATSYQWNFGDGSSNAIVSPPHTYVNAGVYSVTLTAFANGCSTSLAMNNYIVILAPQCNFMFTTSDLCLPITVTYSDLSPSAVSWFWEFGDGSTSTLQNPVHTFTTGPSGSVSLTITDASGCSKKRTKTNINYYSASATANVTSGCNPLSVLFTDQSAQATGWQWLFSDGGSSTSQNPLHTFIADGTYDATLVATFPGGCVDTAFYPGLITVQTPNADFFAPSVSGCSPIQISFSNLTSDAVTFLWDFGDGGTSTSVNPTHIYNVPGYYDIRLIATNSAGCSDTIFKPAYILIPGTYSNFSISAATGCQSLGAVFTDSSVNAMSWSWNFGDGSTDTVANPTHSYQDTGSFVVTLITRDTLGCTSSFTYPLPVTIYQNPTAQASTADTVGCSSYTASFTNQSTLASGYVWVFGDGDTSVATNPTHTYNTAGIYYPFVIATTTYGCRDTFPLTQSINVKQTPIAQFTPSDTLDCEPATLLFTNTSTQTVSPSYNWTFGNTQTSSAQNPTTVYTTANTYNISLIINNNNGCSDTITQQVLINPSPIANATTNDWEGCQAYTSQLINNSTGANSYQWYMGNGDVSPATAPSYTYLLPGIWYPSLVATNNFGCTDTFNFTTPITVHATPVADFIASTTTLCTPGTLSLTNTSSNLAAPQYNWNYGDGTNATTQDGLVTYADSGLYDVTLIVTNTFGCLDSISQLITVNHSPIAQASTTDIVGCSPYTSTFINTTTFADSYLWLFGDGDTSSALNPNHTYISGGNYLPVLIAYNNFGCADTFNFTQPINVKQSPIAAFTSDAIAGCINSTIQFTNQSTLLQNPIYNWNFVFTNDTVPNPVISYTTSGFYDVSLTVTNSNGCLSTINSPAYIEIYDTLPPPADAILSVSVVDDNNVAITWANSSATDLAAYVVYRLNAATGLYDVIYTDSNPKNSAAAATSVYTDSNLDTKNNTYTYLVQTVDRCNFTLPITALIAHTTINVTAVNAGVNIQVNWTPYGGCVVSGYTINRTEVINGSSVVVATVGANTLSFLDTTLNCPIEYSYKITGNDLCGNVYTSLSDTSNATPNNVLAGQRVDIVRSTVIYNKYVLTEWMPPALLPNRVAQYNILRSTDSINYTLAGTAPAAATSFADNAVNVEAENYFYKIVVVNDCNLTGPQSADGSSILLTGEWRNYRTLLNWTKYKEWTFGVDNYTIEKLNNSGNWEFVKSVDGNTTNTEMDE